MINNCPNFSKIRIGGILLIILLGPLLSTIVFSLLLGAAHLSINLFFDFDLISYSFFAVIGLICAYPLNAVLIILAIIFWGDRKIAYYKIGTIVGALIGGLLGFMFFHQFPVFWPSFICAVALGTCHGLTIAFLAKTFSK